MPLLLLMSIHACFSVILGERWVSPPKKSYHRTHSPKGTEGFTISQARRPGAALLLRSQINRWNGPIACHTSPHLKDLLRSKIERYIRTPTRDQYSRGRLSYFHQPSGRGSRGSQFVV
uniref:Putative secreted protein n=1 Tax=Anopheles darlingi TaxID=43151 RepID=A0A2M4D4K2_ANODA